MSGETFDFDLTDCGFGIFGSRGSGKSWLTKMILDSTDSHLVYDPMNEHAGYHRFRPVDRESKAELDEFVRLAVIKWKPAVTIIDESNTQIEPKPTRLPPAVRDCMDFGRHWKIAFGFVARRPVQINADLVELADYLFLFRLTGNNDYRYLEGLKTGLGDAVRDLPRFHFAIFHDGDITIHAPIGEPQHPTRT